MVGGLGNDTYLVDNTGDVVTETSTLVTEIDTVQASINYTLGANVENLTLTGTAAINGTGNALANTITGNSGANTVDGGAGNDTLSGGAGNDTYIFNTSSGADTIVDNDATVGNTDVLSVGGTLTNSQLWFRHMGNNLEVDIIGTTNSVTVQNWYLGSQYQVEQIKTTDGKKLLNTDVEKLVQAMAAFTPPAAGQTTLPPAYQTVLTPLLAANWK